MTQFLRFVSLPVVAFLTAVLQDYVILFVPIEGALSEALREDPALTEHALERNITIATPTTTAAGAAASSSAMPAGRAGAPCAAGLLCSASPKLAVAPVPGGGPTGRKPGALLLADLDALPPARGDGSKPARRESAWHAQWVVWRLRSRRRRRSPPPARAPPAHPPSLSATESGASHHRFTCREYWREPWCCACERVISTCERARHGRLTVRSALVPP